MNEVDNYEKNMINQDIFELTIHINYYQKIVQVSERHIKSLSERIDAEKHKNTTYSQIMMKLLNHHLKKSYTIYQDELNTINELQTKVQLLKQLLILQNQYRNIINQAIHHKQDQFIQNNVSDNDDNKDEYEHKEPSNSHLHNTKDTSPVREKPKLNAFADSFPVESPQKDNSVSLLTSNPYLFANSNNPSNSPLCPRFQSEIPVTTSESDVQCPDMVTPTKDSVFGDSPLKLS